MKKTGDTNVVDILLGHLHILGNDHGHSGNIDAVLEGTAYLSIGFDSRDPDARTPEVLISGNSRPGGMIPVPCCGTEISLRIRNFDDKPFKLNALTVYYNLLGIR